ncbi:MAG: dihydrofolate reductase [Desulfobacteraceae bacterium]|nr:dihydrofolate reductase [Desulfobacteraceae bacterium]
MSIKIIAAIGERGELGYMNDLPWDTITEDMAQFMYNTMDQTLIMGRATWDSLNRNPLPGRTMIVISRKPITMPKGHFWYSSPEEAIGKHPDSWVIGGASLYADAMEHAEELLISHIDGEYLADRYFPHISNNVWRASETEQFNKFKQVRYVKY